MMKRSKHIEFDDMKEENIGRILTEIANAGAPDGQTNLWPRIQQQFVSENSGRFPTGKLALSILSVLLALAISFGLFAPQPTLAALRGVLGYIPGIGLVNTEEKIRVLETTPTPDQQAGMKDSSILSGSVAASQDGVTLSVRQAVIDRKITYIVLAGEGFTSNHFPSDPTAEICTELPRLLLPDGTSLDAQTRGTGRMWITGFEMTYVFPSIPAAFNEAVLEVPCIERTEMTATPDGWELPLQFMTAPPESQPLPVFETGLDEPSKSPISGYTLEKVVELEEHFVLTGSFDPDLEISQPLISEFWPQIVDAEGNQIFYELTDQFNAEVYEPGQFPWEFTIPKGFTSPLSITLDSLEVIDDGQTIEIEGPWEMTWTAPSNYSASDYEPEPSSCLLTPDRWISTLDEKTTWPEYQTGTLVGYGYLEGGARSTGQEESLFLFDLTERTSRELGPGSWPALSPDGSHVVYTGADGLYIINLETGANQKIHGTHEYDYHPRWSPDGDQLAFYRKLDDNIYVMNVDGSDSRMITEYGEIELLIDWLPDSQRLAYGVPSAKMQMRLIDLESGKYQVGTVFDSWALDVGLSPSPNTMAYVEGQGTGAERILISDLERSSTKKLVQFDHRWIISYPVFSPDGNWLAISVTDRQSDTITPALIDLRTCNTYALPDVDGQVFDWSY